VLEHPADQATVDMDPALWTVQTRSYGRTALTLVRPAAAGGPEARHG